MYYLDLQRMMFLTCHGVLPEEKITPQEFMIDVRIGTKAILKAATTDNIEDALNYAEVFEVVKGVVMDRMFDLIEALAAAIGDEILQIFECCDNVRIKVTKMTPPIPEFNGTVACTYTNVRQEGNL